MLLGTKGIATRSKDASRLKAIATLLEACLGPCSTVNSSEYPVLCFDRLLHAVLCALSCLSRIKLN